MHGLSWLRACPRAARCTAGGARSPDLPNDAPNATPLTSVRLLPVCRRSWKWILGSPAAASALSQTRRRKFPRRRGAPFGPVKIRWSSPSCVKQARCQRSTGETRSGNPTVRVPASDFGGPKVRPPPCSSVRERSTRTVRASSGAAARRRVRRSPRRALALGGPARHARAGPVGQVAHIYDVAWQVVGCCVGRLPGLRLSCSRPPSQGRLRRRCAIGVRRVLTRHPLARTWRLRKDGPGWLPSASRARPGAGLRLTLTQAVFSPVAG